MEVQQVKDYAIFLFLLHNTIIVNCHTVHTAPGDYTSTTQLVTFAPGETLQEVSVPVEFDSLLEGDETFTAELSTAPSSLGLVITGDAANATILDVFNSKCA